MSDEMTPEEAYAEAERQIEEARREGANHLVLKIPSLRDIPPSIADPIDVREVEVIGASVADLTPLRG